MGCLFTSSLEINGVPMFLQIIAFSGVELRIVALFTQRGSSYQSPVHCVVKLGPLIQRRPTWFIWETLALLAGNTTGHEGHDADDICLHNDEHASATRLGK